MGQTLEPKLIAAWGKKPAVNVESTPLGITDFELEQNYPNPFNPSTTIRYRLSTGSYVSLKVFNSLGQCAATLAETWKEAGSYDIHWIASVPSGVYFYRLVIGRDMNARISGYGLTRKMIIVE
jgi:hypothetical protein